MNLFKWLKFIGHSGQKLDWKIDCDALTDEDIDCLASLVCSKFKYSTAIGVPTGGLRLADAINRKMKDPQKDIILLVDDVLTTGKSMREAKKKLGLNKVLEDEVSGVVIFSRYRYNVPWWVTPIFSLEHEWYD